MILGLVALVVTFVALGARESEKWPIWVIVTVIDNYSEYYHSNLWQIGHHSDHISSADHPAAGCATRPPLDEALK